MHTIYRLISNWWNWYLDYLYVGYWQLYTFVIRTNISRYKRGRDDRPAVLLIPGIYENWRFMKPLADVIDEAGYRLHVVTRLGRNQQSIEVSAAVVEQYIAEQSLDRYIIVAHSKGGLVGKYIMTGAQGDKCLGMIAINTPFGGSIYGRLFLFGPLKMFSPVSSTIRKLLGATTVNTRIVSIYGEFDPHIPGGSQLNGAVNHKLSTKGHFKVLAHRNLHQLVIDQLAYWSN